MDGALSVQQTADSGYVIAGHTVSLGVGGNDICLIRINAQGDTLWTRTYGGAGNDIGYSVQQTNDGGYIITGSTVPSGAGYADICLIKTNALGETLWTRTYGGSGRDEGRSVQQTADGGYVMVGFSNSFGTGHDQIYLVRTNAHGDTLWTRTLGGSYGYSVHQTTDSGYIIVGVKLGISYEEVRVIKTSASGDLLWAWDCIGDGYSVKQTADGGYVIVGTTGSSGNGDVYLIRADSQGHRLWTKTYGGSGFDLGYSVQQAADGGYIVAGWTYSFGAGNYDVYLLKTNDLGDSLWTRTYGGSNTDLGYAVQQTSDGGYIIAGYTFSFGAGGCDFYVIKTNPDLDVGPIAVLSPPGIAESSQVYVPTVVVRNFGLTGATFPVTMRIGTGYAETMQETLASGISDTVVFPAWTAEPAGSLAVTCFTSLPGDVNPANDTIRDTIQVLPPPFHDVGAVTVVSPSGSVRAGDTVVPRARIRNFGNRSERFFDVRFCIGTSYNQKVNLTDALPADSTAELTFPPWVAETGDWAVSCSTMLAGDIDSVNDKVSSSVRVFEQTLAIEPDQSGRVEAGKSKTYRFHALIQGEASGVVEVTRPSPPPGWSLRLGDAAGTHDLTDTDGDGIPDLGYVAAGESGWFALDVTAPSGTQGDTTSLGQGVFLVAGHVGDRPDIADTAILTLTLVPELSVHNFPNPFTDHTSFVIGLPEDGKASLTVYTRAGERICRVITNADLPAGVHVVRWDGVNDNGRRIAPGTYEYLLDYVHAGKTDRIRKRLVLTRQ